MKTIVSTLPETTLILKPEAYVGQSTGFLSLKPVGPEEVLLEIPPSLPAVKASAEMNYVLKDTFNGVDVPTFSGLLPELPPTKKNVRYLVPEAVRLRWYKYRNDLVSVGPPIRNEHGSIVGYAGLVYC